MTPQRLIGDAEAHGYSDSLVPAVNTMIDVSNKLIYSGVFDSLDGAEQILARESATLRLSWAGQEYLSYLCSNPVYLQWALSLGDLPDTTGEFAERRLDAVFRSLVELTARERDELRVRLDQMCYADDEQRRRFFAATEPLVQNCVGDVFFRSMENFLYDLFRSYKRQVERASQKRVPVGVVDAHERLFQEWITGGEKIIHDHTMLFEKENDEWRRTLNYCTNLVYDVFKIRRVVL